MVVLGFQILLKPRPRFFFAEIASGGRCRALEHLQSLSFRGGGGEMP